MGAGKYVCQGGEGEEKELTSYPSYGKSTNNS